MNLPFPANLSTATGLQLRAARRQRGFTQRRLAEVTGLDLDTVANLEADRGTVNSLVRALTALGFVLDECGSLDLGLWLVTLRRQRGLSQEKAAILALLSKPTIIKLERGEGRLDSLTTLLAAYGAPLHIRAADADPVASKLSLEIHHGDAADVLKQFPAEHFHACICDPPYGLGQYPSSMIREVMRAWVEGRDYDFTKSRSLMRQDWDGGVPQPSLWREALRTLKPGAHLAVFASPRTADLTTMALRLAGAEVRDSIAWITTGGFPRGQSAGKMLAKRELRKRVRSGEPILLETPQRRYPGAGGRATPIAGHTLSAEKLLSLTPEAASVLENFSGMRSALKPAHQVIILARKPFSGALLDNAVAHGTGGMSVQAARYAIANGSTRYPANVISDLSELERYYFAPKVTAGEKDRYLPKPMRNTHPTVKPVALMQWLVRLLTEPGATVLDPFAGSGTTGCACALEQQRAFIGIEREQEYANIAKARIEGWAAAVKTEV